MLTKRLSKIFTQETARVKSITFHPQKPVFITGLHSGAIKAWDYQSNACMHEFMDHDGSVRVVAFHPQGDFFISAGDDKVIRLWDYTRRILSKKFTGHTDFVRALDFHPTKPWFVSSSDDQTIKVWNFMTGKCLATATGHSHYVMAVRFLNERTIISGSLDQSLRLWSCESLLDGTKKSSFVPSIIVKQILNGHDRGINTVFVSDDVVVTGGDDREVKLWEYNGNELVEKNSFFNHQGCITSVAYSDSSMVSVGEEGLLIVHDLNKKTYEKTNIDGRFWTVVQKKNIIIGGHDSGFEIYKYDSPKIVCKSDTGYFYTKDQNVYYSNLKTERKVCDPTGLLLSMHSLDSLLLLQFSNHFEVYRKNKCVLKEYAEGVLIKHNDQTSVVVREKSSIYVKALDGETKKVLEVYPGTLMFGGPSHFFVKKGTNLIRASPEGEERRVSLGFNVESIILDDANYAFVSKNDIHLYDANLNLVNSIKEIVNIHGGFFHSKIFIYATTKHLKYLFQEEGVIRSIDTEVYPFYYADSQIFYLTNDGFESIDVDLTEIDFKKRVMEDGDVHHLIESGKLPGLSPLSFLIKKHKGEIALPYITDIRQRFELSLGDNKFEECLGYCKQEKDHYMYKTLSMKALKEGAVEVAEECLLFLEEWNDLFMLYICSGRESKLEDLFEQADDQTKKMIKLFQEDVEFFLSTMDINEDKNDKDSVDKNDEDKNDVDKDSVDKDSGVEEHVSSNSNTDDDAIDDTNIVLDVDRLKEIPFNRDVSVEDKINSGLSFVTEGKLREAIEDLSDALYNTPLDREEDRRMLGSYLSGLNIELKKENETDDVRYLQMSKYFAGLPLRREHHLLAKSVYVYACVKKGNLKTAKSLAEEIAREEVNVVKAVSKALKIEDGVDKYELESGTFCYDVLDVCEDYKTCRFCFTNSKDGTICSLCKVGYLQE